jgi:hypothetical protein
MPCDRAHVNQGVAISTPDTAGAAERGGRVLRLRLSRLVQHHHDSIIKYRKTVSHFTATGMPSQRNQSDSFSYKRVAFYQPLKSKVGLASAKRLH